MHNMFNFRRYISNPQKLIDLVATKDVELTGFNDKFQTSQQKIRDREITKLLKKYVEAYITKTCTQKRYRKILFWTCFSILCVFSLSVLLLASYACCNLGDIKVSDVVVVISLCITFLTAILGLLQIITKYCFPENDEEYITKIVETIQKNDLENKRENIRSSANGAD